MPSLKPSKTCKKCGQKFTMIPQELDFYKIKDLPLPSLCPECRLKRRLLLRNDKKLYNRKCDKCKKAIISVYPQKNKFTIYCEECFSKYMGSA